LEAIYAGDDTLLLDLQIGAVRPLSLAATDLNGDGIDDLIVGHGGRTDLIAVHLGNVYAVYPHPPFAAQRRTDPLFDDESFMKTAQVFAAPSRPDLLGVGDFNNDGFPDVVIASRGEDGLYLLAGDGTGGLRAASTIRLNGLVSAMISGEINRPDGLADLVVTARGPRGHVALIFEDPRGALNGEPERLELPTSATSLTLERLDDDPFGDLAVGAGYELLIFHGRDRRLSLPESTRGEVQPVVVESRRFAAPIVSVTAADLLSGTPNRPELTVLTDDGTIHVLTREASTHQPAGPIASRSDWTTRMERRVFDPAEGAGGIRPPVAPVVAARVSGDTNQSVLMLDPTGRCLIVLDEHLLDSDTSGSAGCALEPSPWALGSESNLILAMRLGLDALTDLVMVHDGSLVVAKTAPLATILVNSADDTLLAGDGSCTLREAITNANTNADTTAGDCAAGVALDQITFFNGGGGSTAPIFLSSPLPPIADAVVIDGTSQGCTSPPCIELIGTLAGATDVDGLQLEAGGNTIRGLAINGFSRSGIRITSTGNFVEGNFIGTDLDGTVDLGNGTEGIIVIGASNNTIGGTTPGAGNLISGNVAGIDLRDSSTSNRIIGNYIGTNANGTAAVGNTRGVVLIAAGGNTIGGASPGEGNLISGNGAQGILVQESDGTVIQGNLVGVDATGRVAVKNNSVGIFIQDTADATIGGTAVGAGNVISGNGSAGMVVREINGFPTTANKIQGNFVGTDESGRIALPNALYGVFVAAKDNIVGGTGTARNVISANGNHGIYIITNLQQLPPSEGNQVLGNYIGTDVTGTVSLGNARAGVNINDASTNTIGGVNVGEGNVIAYNQEEGVIVQGTASDNMVSGNRISSNGLLAIDLGPSDGVTANDLDDPDVGPNALQNFPVLSVADASPVDSLVEGSLNSIPNSSFRVEFFANSTCDNSQHGEGDRFLGFTDVTTTAAGMASFSVVLPAWIADGDAIAATATSDTGSTSEFGACLVASCSSISRFAQTMFAPDKQTFAWSTPADVSYASGDLTTVSTYTASVTGTRFGATGLSTAADAPLPGSGLYYLVKPLGCGSWQTPLGSEPGRDSGLP
jgi:CSLREA domain-containing protein